MSVEFLVDLCKPGPARFARIVANPLPADATCLRVGYDSDGTLMIVLRSASFAEVEHGGVIPTRPAPTFEIVYHGEPEGVM